MTGELSESEQLNARLHHYESQALQAVESIERALIGDGELSEDEVTDLILATDNLQGAAIEVAQYEDLDL